jgi:hypothetical protein
VAGHRIPQRGFRPAPLFRRPSARVEGHHFTALDYRKSGGVSSIRFAPRRRLAQYVARPAAAYCAYPHQPTSECPDDLCQQKTASSASTWIAWRSVRWTASTRAPTSW